MGLSKAGGYCYCVLLILKMNVMHAPSPCDRALCGQADTVKNVPEPHNLYQMCSNRPGHRRYLQRPLSPSAVPSYICPTTNNRHCTPRSCTGHWRSECLLARRPAAHLSWLSRRTLGIAGASGCQCVLGRELQPSNDFRGVCPISTAPMMNTNILEQAVALRA